MRRKSVGRFAVSTVAGERVRAFIPAPLPPQPALRSEETVRSALDQAHLALGRLDGATASFPNVDLLLYTFQRKEAVLSSQIEGTQSTLDDLLAHEAGAAPGVPLADVSDVSRYVAATTHGLRRLRVDNFPISNRLLREMHAILLESGRGAEKTPGEFRRSQNWIGGSRPGNAHFIPPPPQEVQRCMGELERFLHSDTPALTKAALAHLQFETIHPFLDGNGRIGRLLVTLVLCNDGVLSEPLLYPSLYFKQHRQQYYSELNAVRESGDFERWLAFFATAIKVSAESATVTGQKIVDVFKKDRELLKASKRPASTALLVQEALQAKPLATIGSLTQLTGLTTPTVTQALRQLEQLGIVRETTGKARGRVFAYSRYLDALNAENTLAAEIPRSELICEAIKKRALLEFSYRGLRRVVAPYCFGVSTRGRTQLLRAIQVRGTSGSGAFGFGKLWQVSDMEDLRVLDETFTPDDPNYNPDDSGMKQILCRI